MTRGMTLLEQARFDAGLVTDMPREEAQLRRALSLVTVDAFLRSHLVRQEAHAIRRRLDELTRRRAQ